MNAQKVSNVQEIRAWICRKLGKQFDLRSLERLSTSDLKLLADAVTK